MSGPERFEYRRAVIPTAVNNTSASSSQETKQFFYLQRDPVTHKALFQANCIIADTEQAYAAALDMFSPNGAYGRERHRDSFDIPSDAPSDGAEQIDDDLAGDEVELASLESSDANSAETSYLGTYGSAPSVGMASVGTLSGLPQECFGIFGDSYIDCWDMPCYRIYDGVIGVHYDCYDECGPSFDSYDWDMLDGETAPATLIATVTQITWPCGDCSELSPFFWDDDPETCPEGVGGDPGGGGGGGSGGSGGSSGPSMIDEHPDTTQRVLAQCPVPQEATLYERTWCNPRVLTQAEVDTFVKHMLKMGDKPAPCGSFGAIAIAMQAQGKLKFFTATNETRTRFVGAAPPGGEWMLLDDRWLHEWRRDKSDVHLNLTSEVAHELDHRFGYGIGSPGVDYNGHLYGTGIPLEQWTIHSQQCY